MTDTYSQADLEAYLDEALSVEMMARIEAALREDRSLAQRLVAINGRRDAGVHSLGEIWRRHRLTCPSRQQLGSLLLGVLDPDEAAHIRFHLEVSGCRTCQANLADLQSQQADEPAAAQRRKKYFQSSAGHLRKR
jgi:anti-sigma factor RsiW